MSFPLKLLLRLTGEGFFIVVPLPAKALPNWWFIVICCNSFSQGTSVLLESVPGSGVISVGFWFPYGSRDETLSQAGFCHFIEHMLFKGTKKHDAYSIACEIDRVGGSINAFTEREVTALYTSAPIEYFPRVFEIMCDICFDSIFPDEEIFNEQNVVLNEISSSLDSPEETAFDEFLALYWKNNAISRPIMGTEESIGKIKRKNIYSFYNKYFKPGNCILSVAGDFEMESMRSYIEYLMQNYLSRDESVPVELLRKKPEKSVFNKYIDGQFSQSQVYIGTQFEKPSVNKDYYSHLIFSSAFGESMSSRLFQEVREKQGLCYSIASFRNYYSDSGFWMIYANTRTESTGKLLSAIDSEIKRLSYNMITQTELEDAKMQIKGSLILSKQDVEVRMKRMARQFMAMGEVLTYEQCFALIDEVSIQDMEDTVSCFFQKEPLSIIAYGGKKLSKFKNLNFSMIP